MNPTTPNNTPRYNLITQAAKTLETELSFFSDCNFSDPDKEHSVNNNNNNEELEREIVFLRSCIDYFHANKVYPFAFRCATEDFCNDYTPEGVEMSPEEYLEENERLWNRYKTRVWRICKKLEALEDPREQHAFELGNKIWGSVSVHMMQQDYQEDDGTMFSAEGCGCGCEELHEGGILGKYRFLKNAFKFVESKEDDDDVVVVVEKPMDDEGSKILDKYRFLKIGFNPADDAVVVEKQINDEGRKKKLQLQIEELKNFVDKVNTMRGQALTLLDEFQT